MGLPASAVAAHRERAVTAWGIEGAVVLVPSGLRVPIAGTDAHHEFHPHPEHVWLTGLDAPGQVLAFDPGEGFTLFARRATREERIWEGETPSFELLSARTRIDRVLPVRDLGPWLAAREGRPLALLGHPDLEERPGGYGLDARPTALLRPDPEGTAKLRADLTALRRVKDEAELELLRRACAATRAGHLAAMRLAHPGMTERALRDEIEVELLRAGASRPAYETIVAAGPNPAVLHFTPTDRPLSPGDLVLVDAGAEHGGYRSDVTRTFPVSAAFTGRQGEIYDLVLSVQEAAIADARPGKEYRELHLESCLRIAAGLVELGLLRGDPEDLVRRDAHALFFPHGLGHLLGIATHDAGGILEGRKRSDRFGLRYLRADLPLAEGHVVTIEPGVYFIPALLADPEVREEHRQTVDWDLVEDWLGLGGIRIEDDVLVTATRAEVLTAEIPKARREVEAMRA